MNSLISCMVCLLFTSEAAVVHLRPEPGTVRAVGGAYEARSLDSLPSLSSVLYSHDSLQKRATICSIVGFFLLFVVMAAPWICQLSVRERRSPCMPVKQSGKWIDEEVPWTQQSLGAASLPEVPTPGVQSEVGDAGYERQSSAIQAALNDLLSLRDGFPSPLLKSRSNASTVVASPAIPHLQPGTFHSGTAALQQSHMDLDMIAQHGLLDVTLDGGNLGGLPSKPDECISEASSSLPSSCSSLEASAVSFANAKPSCASPRSRGIGEYLRSMQ